MDEQACLKVGAVTYLNTKPLVYRLEEIAPQIDLSFDLPSRLADDLAAGRLDVALVPSIEFFQNPTYTIVSDACIACRGPVLSVKLFSRVAAHEIRTLALDEGSRTSVALVRILLKECLDLQPRLQSLPIGDTLDDSTADAVLLIGDRAIQSPPGRFAEVWDLGDRWRRWSGLPFVFAMWVARPGIELGSLEAAFAEARDAGAGALGADCRSGSGLARPDRAAVRGIFPRQFAFSPGTAGTRWFETVLSQGERTGSCPARIRIEASLAAPMAKA